MDALEISSGCRDEPDQLEHKDGHIQENRCLNNGQPLGSRGPYRRRLLLVWRQWRGWWQIWWRHLAIKRDNQDLSDPDLPRVSQIVGFL